MVKGMRASHFLGTTNEQIPMKKSCFAEGQIKVVRRQAGRSFWPSGSARTDSGAGVSSAIMRAAAKAASR